MLIMLIMPIISSFFKAKSINKEYPKILKNRDCHVLISKYMESPCRT